MLRSFLTKMLVIMTQHFWQQTQNYITKKFGENVEINVIMLQIYTVLSKTLNSYLPLFPGYHGATEIQLHKTKSS